MLCDQSYMCTGHTKHVSLALALPIDSRRPSSVNILTSALICSPTNTVCRQPLSACRGQAESREIGDQFLLPSLHEVRLTCIPQESFHHYRSKIHRAVPQVNFVTRTPPYLSNTPSKLDSAGDALSSSLAPKPTALNLGVWTFWTFYIQHFQPAWYSICRLVLYLLNFGR